MKSLKEVMTMKRPTNPEEFSLASVWSRRVALSFFIQIPKLLVLHQADLGITTSEFNLIITIHYYKWTSAHPFASAKTLSNKIGLSEHAIRKNINRLADKGYLVKIDRGPNKPNAFDFTPLIEALEGYPHIPTKTNPQATQIQTPTYTKMNTPGYSNMGTELYEAKEISLSRRTGPSGKLSTLEDVLNERYPGIANKE